MVVHCMWELIQCVGPTSQRPIPVLAYIQCTSSFIVCFTWSWTVENIYTRNCFIVCMVLRNRNVYGVSSVTNVTYKFQESCDHFTVSVTIISREDEQVFPQCISSVWFFYLVQLQCKSWVKNNMWMNTHHNWTGGGGWGGWGELGGAAASSS